MSSISCSAVATKSCETNEVQSVNFLSRNQAPKTLKVRRENKIHHRNNRNCEGYRTPVPFIISPVHLGCVSSSVKQFVELLFSSAAKLLKAGGVAAPLQI